ncbi:MAG: hypothetical protein HKN05_03635, partial [Rhizobiales bacterium]|nr:hypothetical protein [Hyphomicrobiales bacterium]
MRTIALRLALVVCVLAALTLADTPQAMVLERGSDANWSKTRKLPKAQRRPDPFAALPVEARTEVPAKKKRNRYWRRNRTPKLPEVVKEPEFLTYEPSPLTSIHNPKIAGDLGESSYSRWVFDTLRIKSKPVLWAEKEDRKAILAFYSKRKFEPVWIGNTGLNDRAIRLLELLSQAH